MTPREFAIAVEVYNSRYEEEQERTRQEAYLSALLVSQFVGITLASKRKIPTYEKLFGQLRVVEMSDAEMLRKVEHLNSMFGGDDRRKEVG